MEQKLSVYQEGGDRREHNFRSGKCQDVQDWSPGTTAAEIHKYRHAARLSLASMSKYLWFVSPRRTSLNVGIHVIHYYSSSGITFAARFAWSYWS